MAPPISSGLDPVEKRNAEILSFKLPCPLENREKMVGPLTCRNCAQKKTCPEVQSLLGASKEYSLKFKGTLLESAMKRAGESKKKVADFILDF